MYRKATSFQSLFLFYSVSSALLLCRQGVALSKPPPSAQQPLKASALPAQHDNGQAGLFIVTVPQELGYVLETHPPTANGGHAATIIHIQEAHADYEAQKNLIGILKRLIADHGLKLILVEGGQGDVGLEHLRRHASPQTRTSVAEEYLRLGVLSGEEYLDIVSDQPLILWGVEQRELYDQHVQAFLDVESLQKELTPTLEAFRAALAALKAQVSEPLVTELEAKRHAFEENRLGVGDYATWLKTTAESQQVSVDASPQLARFLLLRDLEKRIQATKAQDEQQQLIQTLRTQLPPERFAALTEAATQMHAGTGTPQAFYDLLTQEARAASRSIEPDSDLGRYILYLTERARMQPTVLADELDRLSDRLRQRLVADSSVSRLYAIADSWALVEKLVALKLSPQEYDQFRSAVSESTLDEWAASLNALLAQRGLPAQAFPGLEALQGAIARLRKFYEAANARDGALVTNTLAKLSDTGERIAVLITGGFHAPEITRRLSEAGVGIVAVAPKVGAGTDEELYRAVLKYKSGHGSFEDVKAAALRARPTTENTKTP